MVESRAAHARGGTSSSRSAVVTRVLVIAIFVVLGAILTLLLWAVASGVFQRQAPRTFVERQVDMLESVVKEKPKSEEAWADYALALVAAKQYTRAESVLNRADKAVGKNVIDLELARAHLAYARGDKAAALKSTEMALKDGLEFRAKEMQRLASTGLTPDPTLIKGPILASAYYFHAQLLAERKDFVGAVEDLDRALAEESTSADALVMRGNLHIELSNEASAAVDFTQALEFIPNYQPAVEGMARLGEEAK